MADLSTKVGALRLGNPAILASGISDVTAELMLAAIDGGAAAVVTKSIGLKPREGHKNPTVVELENGVLNAMGLPNPGISIYSKEISKVADAGGKVIASVFGKNATEFSFLAKKVQAAGACAVELNLSCPHAKGYGAELGSDPEIVREITSAVKRSVKIPVFPKLTPNVADIAGLAKAAERGGADAVVAINTVKAMKIDPWVAMPVLSNRIGGYSGPAIRPIGVRCVYEIAGAVKIPVIGAGGITNGSDALEYIMAGACAVQIGTAVGPAGTNVFGTVCAELEAFMDARGYRNIKAMVGKARCA